MERTERTEAVQACMRALSMTQWYFNLVGKKCLFNVTIVIGNQFRRK